MFEVVNNTPVEIFSFYVVAFLSFVLAYPIFKLLFRAIGVRNKWGA